MSNGRVKRVSFSLHLNPGDSLADLRAFNQLQQWHQGLKASGSEGEREDIAMEMRSFHRSIYLAGLQLQLLSPKLCSQIAESIGRESLTLAELVAELAGCGLLPQGVSPGAAAGEEFSEQQLKQLQQLMKKTLPEPVPEMERGDTGQTDTQQAAELARLRGEIEKMNHLLQQQNLQLQQLRRGERHTAGSEASYSGKSEEMALNEMAAPTEKMKQVRQKGIF